MDPLPRMDPQPRTPITCYLPQQRRFSKSKIMHPTSSPPPGNCQRLIRSLLFNTDHGFARCVHLCVLARGAMWRPNLSQAQAPGCRWGEQETVGRKDESGFSGLRMQTDCMEKAGTLLAQSSRNPGPKDEKQVASHSHHMYLKACVCVFL